MIFSLFQKKKNEYIEKEMDNFLEKEDKVAEEDSKIAKTLTYLRYLIKI